MYPASPVTKPPSSFRWNISTPCFSSNLQSDTRRSRMISFQLLSQTEEIENRYVCVKAAAAFLIVRNLQQDLLLILNEEVSNFDRVTKWRIGGLFWVTQYYWKVAQSPMFKHHISFPALKVQYSSSILHFLSMLNENSHFACIPSGLHYREFSRSINKYFTAL